MRPEPFDVKMDRLAEECACVNCPNEAIESGLCPKDTLIMLKEIEMEARWKEKR